MASNGRLWTDLLTKERKLPEDLEDVLFRNYMNLQDTSINEVKVHGQEVRMSNIHNRKSTEIFLKIFIIIHCLAF